MENETSLDQSRLSKKDSTLITVVLFFTLIGLAIRLTAPLQAVFPLNDGGLFYGMIVDLQAANYALPIYATYNSVTLPFAYPPLAFYLTGWLADWLRIPALDLVRILPALISALTIPAFFLLAKEITDSKLQIVFGVFAFTMLPRGFDWLIMGGGITRSFGLLFALLTMTFVYRFYNGYKSRHLLASILFGALTVVTHPEATVHTAITALVFYLWQDRSLKGFLFSLGIAVGILALTSPWWVLTISRHGIDPFMAAMDASGQDSINPLIGLFIFFRFLFTDEPFLPILATLGLVGLFASLARKQTLLPAWLFILHLIEPRGGPLYMMIPLALLIGYALENVILPALRPKGDNPSPVDARQALESVLRRKASRYFLLFLFAYSAMAAYSTSLKIIQELSLQPLDLEAFTWVKENTPGDSQFLLITGQLPLRDAWSEWFPVLTGRHSQATVFGYEWINDGKFGNRVEAYKNLQACSHEDINCLEKWEQGSNNPYSYVYIYNRVDPIRFPLTIHLQQDDNYELVFLNDQTMVFQKAK
jgi:hypothetical protein